MLTGKLLRVKFARDRIKPAYIDAADPSILGAAERLLGLFRVAEGRTRGELQEDVDEAIGEDPRQLIFQGLAKLLEDRCEFEVVAGQPPEKLREAVFLAAASRRTAATPGAPFDRDAVLEEASGQLGLPVAAIEQGLFADLKSEQRLIRFEDITAERLIERYNVALAQAVLLRATGVTVDIRREPPQRFRQLLRLVKFHRLLCEIRKADASGCTLHLDGPLSLFASTQKYGLQLALFLPAVLLCREFYLKAELSWGPQRKPKILEISRDDGLVSHHADTGMYVPPELAMFVQLFRKKVSDWEISEEVGILPLGDGFWAPDFRLVHRPTGKAVLLEVLGFWRKSSVAKHLQRLRDHAAEPFVLAISEQLHIEDEELADLPAGIHRFRQMPLPEEIVRLAALASMAVQ